MTMLESFNSEIEAIRQEIRNSRGKTLKDDALRERLRQLLETWHTMREYVASFYKDAVSLSKIDESLEEVARDAYKKVQKYKFSPKLRFIKNEISSRIQIEEIKAGTSKGAISDPVKMAPEIPDLPLILIPKSLIGWKSHIQRFSQKHPFDRNVFIMTRYANSANSVIKAVMDEVNNFEYEDKRFNPVIANQNRITDDLNNPIACLLCCRYGVAIFDPPSKSLPAHNPNVAYELGFMHLLQRGCLILKSNKLRSMPTDILHKLYEEYSSIENVKALVRKWLRGIVQER